MSQGPRLGELAPSPRRDSRTNSRKKQFRLLTLRKAEIGRAHV